MLQYSNITNKKTIKSDYLGEGIKNLLDQTFAFPTTEYSYNVVSVEKDYIARPDLISLDAYGDSSYADILCKINGISNPFELNEGMVLIVPSPENISDFIYLSDDEDEPEYNSNNTTNHSKQKNDKRSPNEAVVGDKRFKIDKGSKIIIY